MPRKQQQQASSSSAQVEANDKGSHSVPKQSWLSSTNGFLALMLSSMLIGAGGGCALRFGLGVTSKRAARFIGFPGQVWMDLLRCMIIPLATVTVMASVLQQKAGTTSRLSALVVGYYLSTTVLAAVVGVVPVLLLRPGRLGADTDRDKDFEPAPTIPFVDSVFDLLRNLFPDSIVGAALQVRRSSFAHNSTNPEQIRVESVQGMNVMGLIVLSAMFAVFARKVDSDGTIHSLVTALFKVTAQALLFLKWATPLGLLFLIAQRVIEMGDVAGSALGLGLYLLLFTTSLLVHSLGILLAIFLLATRRSPLRFLKAAAPAAATALATSSSAASMGVSRDCCVNGLSVRPAVADFMIPIGATLNMDGGAVHLASAAIFIAQLNGIALDAGRLLLIVLTAFAFAVGGSAVPSAGLLSLQMMLHASSLPVRDVPLLVAVEWITDRSLTVVNVLGDLYGCCVVERLFVAIWGSEALEADAAQGGELHSEGETANTHL